MLAPHPVVLLSEHSVGSTCLMIIPPANGSDRKTYRFGTVCDYFPHEGNQNGWPVMQLALKFDPETFDLTEKPATQLVPINTIDFYMARYSFEDPTKIKTCFKVKPLKWYIKIGNIASWHIPQLFREIAVIQL